MSELVNMHSIGNSLKDVKVEFKKDLKLDAFDISIDGKQGEILNIPGWIADVLESEKHVEIQDVDMLVELKQAVEKEKMLGQFDLATLQVRQQADPHFYIKMKSYMKRLPEKDYDKVESMLNTLLRTRQTKIIRLADASKLTAEISQKLSIEEREFYNNLHDNSSKFSKTIIGSKK
ncbi:GINS complex protein [Marine Group I thaumarchaeote SCGC AAA799-D07]|nr:GINS complex protein [Marine Group I thaumarchaeote SCGC AAA799-D07]